MPKKKKTVETTSVHQSTSNDGKFVVLRQSKTGMFLVIQFNDLLTKDKTKISTGTEIAYKTKNRDGGRGTLLLIDDEEKCLSLVQLLEKKESASTSSTAKSPRIDESEQSQDENDDESETSPTTTKNATPTVQPSTASSIEIIRSRPTKPLAEKNQDSSSTVKKRSNENDDDNATLKRAKEDGQSNQYLRSRIIALQDENKKLRMKIEEMETSWMPRPDQVTIEYFARIVAICTGQDRDDEESKGEKLAAIMDVLALSEDELVQCTDPKSIRNTCRRVVRVVFKDELSNPRVHFRTVLRKTEKVGAVRAYGRLMHPLESGKFSDGELNNAMGSDFYQRDRSIKMNTTQEKQPIETATTEDDDAED